MLIYVSGPYRSTEPNGICKNIQHAREAAIKLWEAGHTPICPHLNMAHFEEDCDLPGDAYVTRDLLIIARCDALFLLDDHPRWGQSTGTLTELEFSQHIGVPIYRASDGIPPLHPTEAKYPSQAHGMAALYGSLLRLSWKKNADYSPTGVLVNGWDGVVTRLSDKFFRLMNLAGYKFDVSNVRKEPAANPNYESLEDTLTDLANYAVIGRLVRAGVWGR